MGVEVVFYRIIVCRGGYDNKVGVAVSLGGIKGRGQVEILFCEIILDIFVLDRRLTPVYHLDFFGDDVDGGYVVVLSQKSGDAHAYVACAGHRYVVLCHILVLFDCKS